MWVTYMHVYMYMYMYLYSDGITLGRHIDS